MHKWLCRLEFSIVAGQSLEVVILGLVRHSSLTVTQYFGVICDFLV